VGGDLLAESSLRPFEQIASFFQDGGPHVRVRPDMNHGQRASGPLQDFPCFPECAERLRRKIDRYEKAQSPRWHFRYLNAVIWHLREER